MVPWGGLGPEKGKSEINREKDHFRFFFLVFFSELLNLWVPNISKYILKYDIHKGLSLNLWPSFSGESHDFNGDFTLLTSAFQCRNAFDNGMEWGFPDPLNHLANHPIQLSIFAIHLPLSQILPSKQYGNGRK